MHSSDSSTAPMTTERERQIADGLRWAQALLAAFGLPDEPDVASLVALRAIEWADDDMPAREIRRLLQTPAETRPAAAHPPSESSEALLSAVVARGQSARPYGGGPTHAA